MKLSETQKRLMRRLPHVTGNTNSTANALQRRGLVEHDQDSSRNVLWYWEWKATAAGREWLENDARETKERRRRMRRIVGTP